MAKEGVIERGGRRLGRRWKMVEGEGKEKTEKAEKTRKEGRKR